MHLLSPGDQILSIDDVYGGTQRYFRRIVRVVCTNDDEIYEQLRFTQNGVGAVPSPFDCYLAHRGLKTLHVRMEAASRNAMAIALFLEHHEGVSKVVYPGLESHPQHDIAKSQQHGFGAMITFYCKGEKEQSSIILQSVRTLKNDFYHDLCSLTNFATS